LNDLIISNEFFANNLIVYIEEDIIMCLIQN